MTAATTTTTATTSSALQEPSLSAAKREQYAKERSSYGASGTSCYTTETKKDVYDTLDSVLDAKCQDPQVRQVLRDMLRVCADITEALRTALVTVEGSTNDFGDAQLSVDMIADQMIWDAVKESTVVREGASEEDPIVRDVSNGNDNAEFTVCWDPLDGSSIVDNNWAVGTIMGIWPKSTGLIGATGRDQVTSLVALYGPRTTVLVALDDGTYEFTYGCSANVNRSGSVGGTMSSRSSMASLLTTSDSDSGNSSDNESNNESSTKSYKSSSDDWICTRSKVQIRPTSKIFSPANMRAAQDLSGYQNLINHYMINRYTLRYSGGLVPDVYQQFTKTQGVFCNPTSESSPAKLRLAFEAAPFGMLVEKSGGKTSDGVSGASILDTPITAVDQRTALCIGSSNEVDRFNDMLGLTSK